VALITFVGVLVSSFCAFMAPIPCIYLLDRPFEKGIDGVKESDAACWGIEALQSDGSKCNKLGQNGTQFISGGV